MRKLSKRIVTLLAAFGTVIGVSAAAPAATQAQSSDQTLTAQEETIRNDAKNYITIDSPKDGDVFCQGQPIEYVVSSVNTWPGQYSTRPFITIREKEGTNHTKPFEFPEDIITGQKAHLSGSKPSDSLIPGKTYMFGVMHFAYEDGNKVNPQPDNQPLLAVDIKIRSHKYDSGKETKAATCTEDGVKTYTCEYCGGTKTEPVPATGHSWNDGVVTQEPDVGEAGVKAFTCTKCGATKTEAIDALAAAIRKVPGSVKATAKKRKVTVTWAKIKKKNKKLLRQIKSVEVQYSTTSQFDRDQRWTRKFGKNKTKTVLVLQPKKTYYIRVRYVGADGASNWSRVRKVKVK